MKWILHGVMKALLFIFISLVMMELILQAGSLLVKGSVRETAREWITPGTRLLALGDSNTFGLYLELEDAYPAQLEKRWNVDHERRPIEVLNLGYPGMSSFRVLDNIDALMEKLQPDVVLLTVGVNDFFRPVEQIADHEYSTLNRTLRVLGNHSRLYYLIHRVYQTRIDAEGVKIDRGEFIWMYDRKRRLGQALKFHAGNKGEDGNDVIAVGDERLVVVRNNGVPARSFVHLRENLDRIWTRLQRYDADFYLLTYAASVDYYQKANREIRASASLSDIKFIDVAKALQPRCVGKRRCPEFFFKDHHPNRAGYGLVAEVIKNRLETDWELRD